VRSENLPESNEEWRAAKGLFGHVAVEGEVVIEALVEEAMVELVVE
jgi:hypothetical protein